jgi:hypothetical protein
MRGPLLARVLSPDRTRGPVLLLLLAACLSATLATPELRYRVNHAPAYLRPSPDHDVYRYAQSRFGFFSMHEVRITTSHAMLTQLIDPGATVRADISARVIDRSGQDRPVCFIGRARGWILPSLHAARIDAWKITSTVGSACAHAQP